jgi:hypothetical protein
MNQNHRLSYTVILVVDIDVARISPNRQVRHPVSLLACRFFFPTIHFHETVTQALQT